MLCFGLPLSSQPRLDLLSTQQQGCAGGGNRKITWILDRGRALATYFTFSEKMWDRYNPAWTRFSILTRTASVRPRGTERFWERGKTHIKRKLGSTVSQKIVDLFNNSWESQHIFGQMFAPLQPFANWFLPMFINSWESQHILWQMFAPLQPFVFSYELACQEAEPGSL